VQLDANGQTVIPAGLPERFSQQDLEAVTILGDPTRCFIALFSADKRDRNFFEELFDIRSEETLNRYGGVYLVSPLWFQGPPLGHPGGNFRDRGWCGTPRYDWTDAGNGRHRRFEQFLETDQNLVENGLIVATYIGEYDLGNRARASLFATVVAACSLFYAMTPL
jgi:hypothetical protein